MAIVLAEAMLSTAANIAPILKRSHGPAGWCTSEDTTADKLEAWQEGEAARYLLCTDPRNFHFPDFLKAGAKRLKRVRLEAVRTLFEEFVGQLLVRIKYADQCGFY
ncbi:MAG: hypothetical protein ABJO88_00010 [Parasphingorhabdus sp.]